VLPSTNDDSVDVLPPAECVLTDTKIAPRRSRQEKLGTSGSLAASRKLGPGAEYPFIMDYSRRNV